MYNDRLLMAGLSGGFGGGPGGGPGGIGRSYSDYHAYEMTKGGGSGGSGGGGGGSGGGFGCGGGVIVIVVIMLIFFIADGASWDAIETLLAFGILAFLFARWSF